jgi:hypothetical protein
MLAGHAGTAVADALVLATADPATVVVCAVPPSADPATVVLGVGESL